MALLAKKYPNRDLFILDIADVVLKDDTASMEHPIFSLSTKPDMRELHYEHNGNTLIIKPSIDGLATIHDKDVLIFAISQLIEKMNRGEEIKRRVTFTAHSMLVATNRDTNNLAYDRLEMSIERLRGTTLKTNIKMGGQRRVDIFGIIDSGGFIYDENEKRLEYVQITLSDWLFDSIKNNDILTISNDYFLIRKPLQRRIYEIARKHCGNQKEWKIALENLKSKSGSNSPLYKFRFNIRKMIEENDTPDYTFSLNENDIVCFKPKKKAIDFIGKIIIPTEVEEEGRQIALQKRVDYYAMERDWLALADEQTRNGNPPKNIKGAFLGFCKKYKP